uniref:DUF5640 domain-containing protein n=1 Tax=Eubacterium sp. TaxID=142586 RepID=UPI0040264A07
MGNSELFDNENSVENTNEAEISEIKAKKPKMVFSAKQVILIVVIAVVVVCLAGTGIICAKNNINPVSYIAGEVTKNQIVGKWQSQTVPGLSAYEFYDDGTYTSYISTYTFDGEYTIEGDKLTLKNTSSNQSVTYKYSIVGDTLSLVLVNQNGSEFTDSESSKFDKVDTLNQKSITEMLDEISDLTTTSEAKQ